MRICSEVGIRRNNDAAARAQSSVAVAQFSSSWRFRSSRWLASGVPLSTPEGVVSLAPKNRPFRFARRSTFVGGRRFAH
jgi:hypothetical protein